MNFFLSETSEDDMEIDSRDDENLIPASSIPDNLFKDFAESKGLYVKRVENMKIVNKPWEDSQRLYFSLHHKHLSDIFLLAIGRSGNLVFSRFEIERKRKNLEKREALSKKKKY